MIGIINKEENNDVEAKEEKDSDPSLALALTHPNPTTQLLLSCKPLIHRTESGLNPLVDAAAYLFSIMGKLKYLKSYKNLDQLHTELVEEIKNFQATIEPYHYHKDHLDEYLPVSCYALCITLDDIIATTPWGGQGKWDAHRLVMSFNQEELSHESFLIILERLVRDPNIYIDMMEFLYICLSLGFKCHYNASEFGHEQLEQITNSLYKRIRTHRGNFNKALSPYSIKPRARSRFHSKEIPASFIILAGSVFFVACFTIGKYLLDHLKWN